MSHGQTYHEGTGCAEWSSGEKGARGRLKSSSSVISTAGPTRDTTALAAGLHSEVLATWTFIFTAYPAHPVVSLLLCLLLRSLFLLQKSHTPSSCLGGMRKGIQEVELGTSGMRGYLGWAVQVNFHLALQAGEQLFIFMQKAYDNITL